MNCVVAFRRLVLLVSLLAPAALAAGCAGSSSASNESAVSAGPVAPAPPIATERTPAAGVPAPQVPAAVKNPPSPPPPASAPMVPLSASTPIEATAGYTGPDPCQLATKGDSPVAKACKEGGIKSAKATMKDLVKGARAGGVRFQCDDCHVNDTDYTQLAKNAEDKFAKLLAAANRK